jgi:hypothetical protein
MKSALHNELKLDRLEMEIHNSNTRFGAWMPTLALWGYGWGLVFIIHKIWNALLKTKHKKVQ